MKGATICQTCFTLSVEDMILQTRVRCLEGTYIQSKALVHSKKSHAGLNFTSRILVRYKIQKRQMRMSLPDDHYCRALWKYMRAFAIKFTDTSVLFCCDDKVKIPFGEPDVLISIGVRGKKTITPVGTILAACDHAFIRNAV